MAGLLLSFNSGTTVQTYKGKVILPSRHYKTEASRHGMFLFNIFNNLSECSKTTISVSLSNFFFFKVVHVLQATARIDKNDAAKLWNKL